MTMKFNLAKLQLSNVEKCHQVCESLNCLVLDDACIERIKGIFETEMTAALRMQPSSLQMENTYIPELPDGKENGTYLALDLGGTNLRVLLLSLDNGKIVKEYVQHYPLEDALRVGCGDALFDYLAECVDAFAVQQRLEDTVIYPLGFTFSFPMRQNGLDSGVLITWTKSFNCPSTVGQDAVQKLRLSLLKRKRTNVHVVAILNDTTGTLMHGALLDKNTRVGVVLGTGSNGCYIENAAQVQHWQQQRHGERQVIIDVEWGAFGDNGVLEFMCTDFDRIVDSTSLMKNSFTFEKYIGGKYLGELCRVILQSLHDRNLFLSTIPVSHLPKPWMFASNNVSAIEHDTIADTWEKTKAIFDTHFNAREYSADDLQIVRYVCGLVSQRAAQLVAITISSLLNRMKDETEITVAIDGSVYKHHPRLRSWLMQYTRQWAPTKNCKFMLAEDGSGKGAALVAAIAQKLLKREY